MKIVRAEKNQYGAVRTFYHSLIDAMAAGSAVDIGWKKDIYPEPEFLEDSIRNGEMYLVTEGEEILGAMVLNHEYNEGYEQFDWQTEADDSEVLVIHALGVHPDHARNGYAKAMVRRAIELAETGGMKAIRLDVLDGNTPAENLYSGLGFRYMAALPMYYEDTGWMKFHLYEYVIGSDASSAQT